jgi:hypothetical protein
MLSPSIENKNCNNYKKKLLILNTKGKNDDIFQKWINMESHNLFILPGQESNKTKHYWVAKVKLHPPNILSIPRVR